MRWFLSSLSTDLQALRILSLSRADFASELLVIGELFIDPLIILAFVLSSYSVEILVIASLDAVTFFLDCVCCF